MNDEILLQPGVLRYSRNGTKIAFTNCNYINSNNKVLPGNILGTIIKLHDG